MPYVEQLKDEIQKKLLLTGYDNGDVIDGIYVLHLTGFHQMCVCARMFATVCTSVPEAKPESFTKKQWIDHDPKVLNAYSFFPPEIAIFLEEISDNEWTLLKEAGVFQDNEQKPFKFVSRKNFHHQTKKFLFKQKWTDIKSKLYPVNRKKRKVKSKKGTNANKSTNANGGASTGSNTDTNAQSGTGTNTNVPQNNGDPPNPTNANGGASTGTNTDMNGQS